MFQPRDDVGAAGFGGQAALRSPSRRRSHSEIRFQLAKVWLTNLIDTAPEHSPGTYAGSYSLCHISRPTDTLCGDGYLGTTFITSFDVLMLAVIFHWRV